MSKIVVIGAGITGVTSAYFLSRAGHEVVVLDRHRYAAMETSYANGGQLSASNAEVWNNAATLHKGLRWMFRRDAPLLFNPAPSWHKFSWLGEFLLAVRRHTSNSIATAALACKSRSILIDIAERERIAFDLKMLGILHICHDKTSFDAGLKTNALLARGGLERRPVTTAEISEIEPALRRSYYGGFYTPSDASGDIHKFTTGLARVCEKAGVQFVREYTVEGFEFGRSRTKLLGSVADESRHLMQLDIDADSVLVCAGVKSRELARMLGDRINIYPVKGYSITVALDDAMSQQDAPEVSLLDEDAKIVTSRLGSDRFRVAGTAELNGFNLDIRADRVAPLTAWVQRNFPTVSTAKVVPWAGLRPMMPDMMPVVRKGRRPGVYYNTGHGHLGWTLAAATAELVAGLMSADSRCP